MDHDMPDAPRTRLADTNITRDRAREVSEMKQWAENLKLGAPIPRDLLPLLAKDDAKQLEIVLRNMRLETERSRP